MFPGCYEKDMRNFALLMSVSHVDYYSSWYFSSALTLNHSSNYLFMIGCVALWFEPNLHMTRRFSSREVGVNEVPTFPEHTTLRHNRQHLHPTTYRQHVVYSYLYKQVAAGQGQRRIHSVDRRQGRQKQQKERAGGHPWLPLSSRVHTSGTARL